MSQRILPINNELIIEVKQFAITWIQERVPGIYVFHDVEHTRTMVEAAIKIGAASKLTDTQMADLTIAAWFHDIGYNRGPQDHEKRGAQYAATFLKKKQHPTDRIFTIHEMILATKLTNTPHNLLQEIIRDADLAHLGNAFYWESCKLLREELRLVQNIEMTDAEWIDFELNFLEKHQYHTPAAKVLYQGQKNEYIKELKHQKKA